MVNARSLENDKANLIKSFSPVEMEGYITSLVTILYESYLENDKAKALASKRLIEEATSLYESKGYDNSLAVELRIRLAKANEVLVETLEAKEEQKIELYKTIVANAYEHDIMKLIHNINILKSLLASYRKTPSEDLASAMKDVLYLVESDLVGINFLLEEKEFSENGDYAEEVDILKNQYSIFKNLKKIINNL